VRLYAYVCNIPDTNSVACILYTHTRAHTSMHEHHIHHRTQHTHRHTYRATDAFLPPNTEDFDAATGTPQGPLAAPRDPPHGTIYTFHQRDFDKKVLCVCEKDDYEILSWLQIKVFFCVGIEDFHERMSAETWMQHLQGGVGEHEGVVECAVQRLEGAESLYCYQWV
jgi:hypothetical protein